MRMINLLKGWFSYRQKALARYRSGMAKAKREDFAGAIVDYSATIQSSGIPIDVKAMALYNRALAYSSLHEDAKAAEDLASVLKIPGLPENIKIAAGQRRERIRRRRGPVTQPDNVQQ